MVFEEKWFIIIHDKRCRCAMNHLLEKRKETPMFFYSNDAAFAFPSCASICFYCPCYFITIMNGEEVFSKILLSRKCFSFVWKNLFVSTKTKSSFGKGWEIEFFRILVIFSKLITRQSSIQYFRSLKKLSRLILLNRYLITVIRWMIFVLFWNNNSQYWRN